MLRISRWLLYRNRWCVRAGKCWRSAWKSCSSWRESAERLGRFRFYFYFRMTRSVEGMAGRRSFLTFVLWLLIALYPAARILQIFPGNVPMFAVVSLHVLPPLVFSLIHGAMFCRVRGILAFVSICLVIGGVFEYVGVRTGFPFGHYYFTDLMGPKLSVVPIFLGLAYVGMGYLSWMLAVIILGGVRNPISGS